MKWYAEQSACSVDVRGAEVKRAADKGAKHKKNGFEGARQLALAVLKEVLHRKGR